MTGKVEFLETAFREWKSLDANTREQFRKKLEERAAEPHIASAKFHGAPDRYKIKLRSAGYRLVYEVDKGRIIIVVIAVGKRDRAAVYKTAAKR